MLSDREIIHNLLNDYILDNNHIHYTSEELIPKVMCIIHRIETLKEIDAEMKGTKHNEY
jgi:hypothetical protein